MTAAIGGPSVAFDAVREVNMQYISVGRRFVAIFVDGLVSLLWLVPLGETTTEPGRFHYTLSGTPFALNFALWIGYFTLFEALFGGTVGKLLVGIRVVKEDGSRLDLGSALVRSVLRVVDGFPYVIPYLVGAVAVWNTPTRQRVGDRVAKTVVIQAGTNRMPPYQAGMPQFPPPPPPPPGSAG